MYVDDMDTPLMTFPINLSVALDIPGGEMYAVSHLLCIALAVLLVGNLGLRHIPSLHRDSLHRLDAPMRSTTSFPGSGAIW